MLGGGLNYGSSHVSISDLPDKIPGINVAMPTMTPPPGFIWQFLVGLWALVPVNINPSSGVNSMVVDSKEVEGCETQAVDLDSPDHSSESDDSMENLKKSPGTFAGLTNGEGCLYLRSTQRN